MTLSHEAWEDRVRRAVLAALEAPAADDDAELHRFAELQRDYPQRGGKAIRARLVLLSAEAHGAEVEQAVPAAAALELFQNWVLVHDDVEDDSETRRGRPALHRLVGAPLAINVGDAMHVAMWRLLIGIQAPWRDEVLNEFVVTIARTACGQHLDLAWVSSGRFDVDEDSYLAMVERKTAYYTVVAPLRLGALVAGVAPDPRFEPAGLALGAAFQIRDDVLNLLPDATGAYGKELAGDLFEGKRTLLLGHAVAHMPERDALRLRELLFRPRDEKSHEEMHEALELIRRSGAIERVQAVAERKARDGLTLLREALSAAKSAAAAEAIVELVETLARRRA